MTGGRSGSPTYRRGAGAGRVAFAGESPFDPAEDFDAREDEPFAGARPFVVGLVLLAIDSTVCAPDDIAR